MELGLRGRVALVMGASKGIGYAVAKTLAEEGAQVYLCSRSEANLIIAMQSSGAKGYIIADLNQPAHR